LPFTSGERQFGVAENRSLLRECQEIEHRICKARQAFVAEILVDERGFLGLDVVEDGELCGWRASKGSGINS